MLFSAAAQTLLPRSLAPALQSQWQIMSSVWVPLPRPPASCRLLAALWQTPAGLIMTRLVCTASLVLLLAAAISPAAALSWPLCDNGGQVWVTERPSTEPTFPGTERALLFPLGRSRHRAAFPAASRLQAALKFSVALQEPTSSSSVTRA
jgi:hypothetical protein